MQSIEQLRGTITSSLTRQAKRFKLTTRIIEVVMVVGGAVLSGVGAVLPIEEGVPWAAPQYISLFGVALTAIGGAFLIFTREDENHAVEAMASLELADSHRDDLIAADHEIDLLTVAAWQLRSLYVALIGSRGMIERALAGGISDECRLLESILFQTRADLRIAFGFEMTHTWTMAIYRREVDETDGNTYLRCVAHDRSIMCDISKARRWREGVGVSGMALARNDEVVAPDIQDPAAVSLFGLNGDTFQREDRWRYRSLFAVPVNVGNDAKPWGVVLASCSEPNHFTSPESDWELGATVGNKEALRSLAGIVALAIATCRSNLNTVDATAQEA